MLISSTFSANTQTLDTRAAGVRHVLHQPARAILTNNSSEIDRLIDNLDLIATDVLSPELQTLDSALKGVDEAAKHTFLSARLGEWLNEAILCAAVGPPARRRRATRCRTSRWNRPTSGATPPTTRPA